MKWIRTCIGFVLASAQVANAQSEIVKRQPDGKAEVAITGELKEWRKVTLTLDGPFAHERDTQAPFQHTLTPVTTRNETVALTPRRSSIRRRCLIERGGNPLRA